MVMKLHNMKNMRFKSISMSKIKKGVKMIIWKG